MFVIISRDPGESLCLQIMGMNGIDEIDVFLDIEI